MSKFIGKKVRLKGSKQDCLLGVGVVVSVDQGLAWSGVEGGGFFRMDRFKIHFSSRTMGFFIDEVEFINTQGG
jgi:hypothetical protein|tara:strand:- start:1325 stop:1543 length:219 start_codon:yes stop_codon:yes gene_type:complete